MKKTITEIPQQEDIYLIVASQSCDVCASSSVEEYIEFSIARKITACEGNFLFNKHPRRLHISAQDNTQDPIADIYFELNANEKIKIKKESILAVKEIEPCTDIQLTTQTTQQFADWLAARYNHPALPTAF